MNKRGNGSASAPCSLTLFGYDHKDYAGHGVSIAIDQRLKCTTGHSDGFKVNDEALDSNKHPLIRAALIHGWTDIDSPVSFMIDIPDEMNISCGHKPAYITSSLGALAMMNDRLIFDDIAMKGFEVIKGGGSMLGPLGISSSINGSGIGTSNEKAGSLWSYGSGKKEMHIHHLELTDMGMVLASPATARSHSNISLKVENFISRQRGFIKDIFKDSSVLAEEGMKALKDEDLKTMGRVLNDTDKLTRIMGVHSDELKALVEVCRRNSHGARLCVDNEQGVIMALTDDPDELCNRIAEHGGVSLKVKVSSDGLMV